MLEALRRRLGASTAEGQSAAEILVGLYGIDLNPLAVLAARASIVVSLASFLDPLRPLNLPIFLADAINPAEASGPIYYHQLQTELGIMRFGIPKSLVEQPRFFDIFARIRELVDAGYGSERIHTAVEGEFEELSSFEVDERAAFGSSLSTLVELHEHGWDGIWCSILAERLAAGNIPPVTHIAGNPPWVKWSNLPPEYAEFIKERCLELGVFSEDRWVGGIESDISTVVTYEVVDKWLASQGALAFFITGTVFANESSQGFRPFELQHRDLQFGAVRVEDFDLVAPFEGVSNHATLLVVRRDETLNYPVPYRVWSPPIVDGRAQRSFSSAGDFRLRADSVDLLAAPVPGSDAGPWLKGTSIEHQLWTKVFGSTRQMYHARKGITTDRNGIYFVEVVDASPESETCTIRNDPSLGRTRGIQSVRDVVEIEHVFPLLRGRGVRAFSATPDPEYRVLLPQRGMHGDPELPLKAPGAYRFLRRFESELKRRSSYRRFQKGQPYWSVWSTGPYTFSPYKVVWREMSGGRFVAAYVGTHHDSQLGERLVIPDHKLYFVPVDTEEEAAFLTGVLNAPSITRAISAYAALLSLGVSVVEYLDVPRFDTRNDSHEALSNLAATITKEGGEPSVQDLEKLDEYVLALFDHVDAAEPTQLKLPEASSE